MTTVNAQNKEKIYRNKRIFFYLNNYSKINVRRDFAEKMKKKKNRPNTKRRTRGFESRVDDRRIAVGKSRGAGKIIARTRRSENRAKKKR